MNPLAWPAKKLFLWALASFLLALLLIGIGYGLFFMDVLQTMMQTAAAQGRAAGATPGAAPAPIPPPQLDSPRLVIGVIVMMIGYVPGLFSLVALIMGFIRYAHELKLERERLAAARTHGYPGAPPVARGV